MEKEQLAYITKTTKEISDELGRTWMSVNVIRGKFMSDYIIWAQKNGKDIINGNPKDLVKEFLEYKQKYKNNIDHSFIKKTKIMKCPECDAGIRGRVISDDKAKCGVCNSEFSIKKEDIDESD